MTLAIHIGYHKTATTWLQRQVFIPSMGFTSLLSQQEVDRLLIKPHDLDFQAEPARSAIQKMTQAVSYGSYPVISSENLSGHPFFGGRQSAAIAKRLQSVVPDAHIVITVRSQDTLLPSVYMQYLQRGGTLSHQDFFECSSGFGYPGFELEHFRYHRLISLYQRLFEKVHVMTYEQFSRSPVQAISNLTDALKHTPPAGVTPQIQRVSASLPQAMAPIIRRINHIRKSTLNPAPAIALSREPGWMYRAATACAAHPKVATHLNARLISDYVKVHFATEFTKSNLQLDMITRGTLDLSSYP